MSLPHNHPEQEVRNTMTTECHHTGESTHNHPGHDHEHHGLHHHHTHEITSLNGVFMASIALNALFVIIEAIVGFTQNSLGLLSDAGHNLSDVFSLLLALIAFKLAKLPNTKHFTYGFKKSTILISLVNAIILVIAVGAIIVESIHKFYEPEIVNGAAISWTAGIGILINGLTAWMLMRSQKDDLNVRGAFLHMLADTLVSVGVVISGLIITATDCYIIDPIISLAIALAILISTWHLLSESLKLSLDGTPEKFDVDEIKELIQTDSRIQNVHHVHIWAISTTSIALTAHLVILPGSDLESIKKEAKEKLKEKGITHSTLEFEYKGTPCDTYDLQ